MRIVAIGLGPGPMELLTEAAKRWIQDLAERHLVVARTGWHPAIGSLLEGTCHLTLDELADSAASAREFYPDAVRFLLERATSGPVVYLVPGSPWDDLTVRLLRCHSSDLRVEMVEGLSYLQCPHLSDRPHDGQLREVGDLSLAFRTDRQLVVAPIHGRALRREAAKVLGESYPGHAAVRVLVCGEEITEARCSVSDLADQLPPDRLCAVRIGAEPALTPAADKLLRVVARLRGPGGCPWDREQTHHSLRPYVVEEAYEVVEAIDSGSSEKLKEELGDLLLQVALHATIARERGAFGWEDVVDAICEKMVRRHPHVFGTATVESSTEVLHRWSTIKQRERGEGQSRLVALSKRWPALLRAAKVQASASLAGFDWREWAEVAAKVREELDELIDALRRGEKNKAAEELGDLLFAVVNLARFVPANPELALHEAVNKFVDRFRRMERAVADAGHQLEELSLEEMDKYWETIKQETPPREP